MCGEFSPTKLEKIAYGAFFGISVSLPAAKSVVFAAWADT
jgi:hypothetical protein